MLEIGYANKMASINAVILGITSDSIFKINLYAYSTVTTSSTACGPGIACGVWFLLSVDLEIFIVGTLLTLISSHSDICSHP